MNIYPHVKLTIKLSFTWVFFYTSLLQSIFLTISMIHTITMVPVL